MTLPTFLRIGAQRAATTWAHLCLAPHSDVFVPERKELAFFNWGYEGGLDWYRDQLAGYSGQHALGEVTPTYLSIASALPRIADVLPEARLFMILRNPIERAFSAYLLLQRQCKWKNFRQACENRTLIGGGMYSRHLDRVYEHVLKLQVAVFWYDDVQQSSDDVLRDLNSLIDVDPSFQPATNEERYNHMVFAGTQRLLQRTGLPQSWSRTSRGFSSMPRFFLMPMPGLCIADLRYSP